MASIISVAGIALIFVGFALIGSWFVTTTQQSNTYQITYTKSWIVQLFGFVIILLGIFFTSMGGRRR